MDELRDKVVLVTGSSRGIGKATILEFANYGCNVVINFVENEQEALEVQKEVEENYEVQTLVIKADISNEEEVKNMVKKIIEKFETIDYLVNNAGIAIDTTIDEKTIANFRRIIDVNLIGTFLVSKYVGEVMRKNKRGRIVNISSTNGIDTYYPFGMDYDASKAGVISLTHNFAALLAPYVNVNSVAPGWVRTSALKEMDIDVIKEEEKKILKERFAEPEEIARVVVFLCSSESSYINNSIIRVDGGFKC